MGNGKEKLAKDWKEIAAGIFRKNPDWNAAQLHRELVVVLGENRVPSLSAVQKYRQTVLSPKAQEIKEKGLDVPWSLGKTPELPAEAISAIFEVQKWAEAKGIDERAGREFPISNKGDIIRHGITIRQAFWITRLHKSVKDKDTEFLYLASYLYGLCEAIHQLTNSPSTPFNTWQLDRALRKGKEELRLLGANILGSDQAFEALFQVHMALERVPMVEIKSWKELAEQSKARLAQIQKKDGKTK